MRKVFSGTSIMKSNGYSSDSVSLKFIEGFLFTVSVLNLGLS